MRVCFLTRGVSCGNVIVIMSSSAHVYLFSVSGLDELLYVGIALLHLRLRCSAVRKKWLPTHNGCVRYLPQMEEGLLRLSPYSRLPSFSPPQRGGAHCAPRSCAIPFSAVWGYFPAIHELLLYLPDFHPRARTSLSQEQSRVFQAQSPGTTLNVRRSSALSIFKACRDRSTPVLEGSVKNSVVVRAA